MLSALIFRYCQADDSPSSSRYPYIIMISLTALATLFSAFAISVNAIVSPLEPSPGVVYRQGQMCRTNWAGDISGSYGQMSIQLMTGNNWNMVHIDSAYLNLSLASFAAIADERAFISCRSEPRREQGWCSRVSLPRGVLLHVTSSTSPTDLSTNSRSRPTPPSTSSSTRPLAHLSPGLRVSP